MATNDDDKKTPDASDSNKGSAPTKTEQTGDPGRTPGSAEGDEETVDESLAQKERDGK